MTTPAPITGSAINSSLPPYEVIRSTRVSRVFAVFCLVAIVAIVVLPFWGSRASVRLGIEIAYYLALAQLWNLLAGYTGMVSIGQQAYVGLGAYAFFALSMFFGVPPMLALVAAGLITAAISVPTAALVFRLRGHYFAIGTWVIAEVWRLAVALVPALGAGSGMSLPPYVMQAISPDRTLRDDIVYWTAIALALFVVALVYLLLRSRQGLALMAIRDNERASEKSRHQ